MNWWAIFAAGLLAGATTCAATQGGLLVGLIARQRKAEAAPGLSVQERVDQMVATRRAALSAPDGKGASSTRNSSPVTSRTLSLGDNLAPVAGFLTGKLIVLTITGAVLGTLGSVVTLDVRIGQFAQVLAGVVMVTLGLATIGVPGMKRFVFTPPKSWGRLVRRSTRSSSAFAPFLLGLSTVLIPCGVTISMMLLAATSRSTLAGAAVMFVFVLGTAPLFTTYGYLTQRFIRPDSKRMAVVMGSVVVAMGLFTVNSFFVSVGSPLAAQHLVAVAFKGDPAAAPPETVAPEPVDGVQTVTINATSTGYEPASIGVKAGARIKVVFRTENTFSCIVYTVFPTLGKRTMLPTTGTTEVDLGVLPAGRVPISCSMGMYTGTLVVS